jgi:hypothetical protein
MIIFYYKKTGFKTLFAIGVFSGKGQHLHLSQKATPENGDVLFSPILFPQEAKAIVFQDGIV